MAAPSHLWVNSLHSVLLTENVFFVTGYVSLLTCLWFHSARRLCTRHLPGFASQPPWHVNISIIFWSISNALSGFRCMDVHHVAKYAVAWVDLCYHTVKEPRRFEAVNCQSRTSLTCKVNLFLPRKAMRNLQTNLERDDLASLALVEVSKRQQLSRLNTNIWRETTWCKCNARYIKLPQSQHSSGLPNIYSESSVKCREGGSFLALRPQRADLYKEMFRAEPVDRVILIPHSKCPAFKKLWSGTAFHSQSLVVSLNS